MNKEVIKAMNRKKKKHTFRKWWQKHSITVLRILFFPLAVLVQLAIKLITWLENRAEKRNAWNEERAKEILNYYIPRRAKWCAKDNSFYFLDNGYGWNIRLAKKYLKRKDRAFWEQNNSVWGKKIRKYLIDEFELEGFTKKVGNCSDRWTEISFTMNEK